jgi:PAS domain S-box-containing protein
MPGATEVSDSNGVKAGNANFNAILGCSVTRLRVHHVMNEDVITSSLGETVFAAAKNMFANSVSCAVVVNDGAVIGILTEKDLLKGVAGGDGDFRELRVQDRMSHPVEVVGPDLPVLNAAEIMRSKRIKRLPVVQDGRLAGIVTQTDITRGLLYLSPLQQVSEIMSIDIATVDVEATVADAARVMASRNISCVVVMNRNEAVGVFTQKDLLKRVIAMGRNPTRMPVSDVMSLPILPIPPDYSVFTASRAMEKMHIHRLVVEDEDRICGIVSQTDIMRAVENKLKKDLERQQLLASSGVPMCAVDRKGMITYVSAGFLRLFEFTNSEQVLDHPFLPDRFWLDPEDRQRFLRHIPKKDSQAFELALKTSTGRNKRVLALAAPTRSAHGETSGWQGVMYDIASHKLAPQERTTPKQLDKSNQPCEAIWPAAQDDQAVSLSAQDSPDVRLEVTELVNSVADCLKKLETSVRRIPRRLTMYNNLIHRAERSRNTQLAKALEGVTGFRGAEPVKHVLDEMHRLIDKSRDDIERITGVVGDLPVLERSRGSSTS